MTLYRCIFTAIVFALFPAPLQADVALVAHPSVPVKELSRNEILDIYTGDIRTWDSGDAVVLFDLKEKTAVKQAFYRYLGKTTSRMKSIWMRNMLSGEGKPPVAMATEEELLAKVASTPGAMGYLDRDKVTSDVVVIAIIPGDQ